MSKWIDYDAIDYRNDKLHDKSGEFLNGVVYMAERIEEAPSIDVPTKPPADAIGYRWKLKWVLEEAPDIIDALTERSSE